MSEFKVTESSGQVSVEVEKFTLDFHKMPVGITSFMYEKGGNEHDCVGDMVYPMVLFAPFFTALSVPGGVLWPDGGTELEVEINLDWFVQVKQNGYMRNPTIQTSTDFPYKVTWFIWPSGRIGCRMEIKNLSGSTVLVNEEAYRLNPPNDSDINPGRDTIPNLEWFGFWSDNTGDVSDDLSHDAICVPYVASLDTYGESGKINRVYDTDVTWLYTQTFNRWFLLALSVEGSWGDCSDVSEFESRGDSISADVKNPDPLNGGPNAGDVITGTLIGSGFDEYSSAITIGV